MVLLADAAGLPASPSIGNGKMGCALKIEKNTGEKEGKANGAWICSLGACHVLFVLPLLGRRVPFTSREEKNKKLPTKGAHERHRNPLKTQGNNN